MTRTAKIYKAVVGGVLALALIFTLATPGYTQTTIPAPGFQPSGLAYDGTFLYVSELSGFRTIYKLNPTTGAVLGSFLAPSPAGFDGNGNPNDLVADGAGRLFVSDIGNIVYEIDATGTTIFNSFSLPFRGGAIAFDGTNLYIGDFDSSQVEVTDRFGNFIRTFDSGLRPAGMVFDPATGHLWVISEFDEKVSEITTNGGLIRSCDGPRNPGVQGLGGVTRVGSKLYIAEVSDPDPFTPPDIPGTIFIVDPGTLTCNPPITVPFAAFNANLEIELAEHEFEVKATFTLGAASDGINPLTEDVSLQIGTFSTTIPAGSFRFHPANSGKGKGQGASARWTFEGVIDGVTLEAKITDLGGGMFEFKVEGEGANLTGTANPVTVTLTIGNDKGTTTVTASRNSRSSRGTGRRQRVD